MLEELQLKMNTPFRWQVIPFTLFFCVYGIFCLKNSNADAPTPEQTDGNQNEVATTPRVSLDEARSRAKLMNTIYVATLDTMHHRYFHGDRAIVPARAMEDIFKDLEAETHTQARWISASLKPMSIDHTPKTDFEKRAAAKIADGEKMVETIEQGFYRRAGSISLNGGCIHCHAGVFGKPSTSSKFAGLIISIPINKDAQLPVPPRDE